MDGMNLPFHILNDLEVIRKDVFFLIVDSQEFFREILRFELEFWIFLWNAFDSLLKVSDCFLMIFEHLIELFLVKSFQLLNFLFK